MQTTHQLESKPKHQPLDSERWSRRASAETDDGGAAAETVAGAEALPGHQVKYHAKSEILNWNAERASMLQPLKPHM